MANHCEKLVRKLTEKYFKTSSLESSSMKASNLKLIFTTFNLRERQNFRDEIRRVILYL
jgi:hypothetical protein